MKATKILLLRSAGLAAALTLTAVSAFAADPSWLDRDLLAKAKANNETRLAIYASMNEREGLPLWREFTEVTGIEIDYVRASDTKLVARITLEKRAGKERWDLIQTASLKKMPEQWLAPIDLPLAHEIPKEAQDPGKRWYGVYAKYNTPAYNTNLVKKADLPKTYEDFLKHPEWAGKVAIDHSDEEWLAAMYRYYGKTKAETLVKSLAKTLRPELTRGHLAMARSVAAGDYAIALNNYTDLIINVMQRGGATGWWVIEPVAVFYGQIGVNAGSSNMNAARLGANYLISREGQKRLAAAGRIPVRDDVVSNPPGVQAKFKDRKVIPVLLTGKESKAWIKKYRQIMKTR